MQTVHITFSTNTATCHHLIRQLMKVSRELGLQYGVAVDASVDFVLPKTLPSLPELLVLQQAICDVTALDWPTITSKSRVTEIINARCLYAYLRRKHYNTPWRFISKELGGFDHTTAIHWNHIAQQLLDTHHDVFCRMLDQITNNLFSPQQLQAA